MGDLVRLCDVLIERKKYGISTPSKLKIAYSPKEQNEIQKNLVEKITTPSALTKKEYI